MFEITDDGSLIGAKGDIDAAMLLILQKIYELTDPIIKQLGNDPDYKPISRTVGFLMGICPVVGQLTVMAGIITGFCDLIFIPDEPSEIVQVVPIG